MLLQINTIIGHLEQLKMRDNITLFMLKLIVVIIWSSVNRYSIINLIWNFLWLWKYIIDLFRVNIVKEKDLWERYMSLQLSKRETCNYLKEILIFRKKILRTKEKILRFWSKEIKEILFLRKINEWKKKIWFKKFKNFAIIDSI